MSASKGITWWVPELALAAHRWLLERVKAHVQLVGPQK